MVYNYTRGGIWNTNWREGCEFQHIPVIDVPSQARQRGSMLISVCSVLCIAALQGSQPLNGAIHDARRSRFRTAAGPLVFTASSQRALLAGVSRLVEESDYVLEIGCQLGDVTRMLADRAACVHGIDTDRELKGRSGRSIAYRAHATPAEAGMDPSQVRLSLLDPWDMQAMQVALTTSDDAPQLASHDAEQQPTVAVIDLMRIVGNDLPLEALALTRQIGRSFPMVRAVLIKSRSLDKLQRQLTTLPVLRAEAGSMPPPSWLPRVVATKGVTAYREAALHLMNSWAQQGRRGIRALEIGCHLGTSTALVHAAAHEGGGFCVGVDVGRPIVQRAAALHPEVAFSVCDAWDVRGLQRALPDGQIPQLVLLDVGGISSSFGELDALALVRLICSAFGDGLEAVVVKSHCLESAARTLQPVGWGNHASPQQGTAATAPRGAAAALTAVKAPADDGAGRSAAVAAEEEAAARKAFAREGRLPHSEAPSAAHIGEVLAGRHGGIALVLEDVRLENAALILRTAECLGVPRVHLVYTAEKVKETRAFGGLDDAERAKRLSRISKRASEWVQVEQHASIDACAAALRRRGCDLLIATTPEGGGAVSLYDGVAEGGAAWVGQPLALMFGSEASGLSERALELADLRLTVAQRGITQSLNVATCATLVVGEVLRRRASEGCEVALTTAEQQELAERFSGRAG